MIEETVNICPSNKQAWRKWLELNHKKKDAIWLIFHKKSSATPNLTWSEAVDEALCFGWIDSTKKTIDSDKYIQYFAKRKPKSTWSRVNKEKVKELTAQKLMTTAGIESIEIAKKNGSWTILDSVEHLIIPKDLEEEFKTKPTSKDFFLSLSKSNRKSILQWIVLAKRADTRERRIKEVVELASKNQKPKQFQ